MRLTLRTLLAYLDDLLEPSHAKEIGTKVQESETAAGLVMKIRDVIRKRRLTAPVVSGPGCDLDANTVAEYLDNTLPPDGVTDLERLCLESDVHLAEVAASHQILTLVLGEPVDIGPLSRERMYALGEAAQSKPTAPPITTVAQAGINVALKPPVQPPVVAASTNGLAPAVKPVSASRPLSSPSIPTTSALAESSTERKPEAAVIHTIPDYLKSPPLWKRALPLAVTLLVIAWLATIFTDRKMLMNILGGKTDAPPQVAGNGAAERGPANPAGDNKKTAQPLTDETVEPGKAPEEVAQNLDEMPLDETPGEKIAKADKAEQDKPAVDPPMLTEGDDAVGPALTPTPATEATSEATSPAATKTAPGTAVAKANTAGTKASAKPPTEAKPAPVVNRTNPALYVSQDGLVLHFDTDRQGWYQLPYRAHVFADDALAIPEPFDAQLQLGRDKHRLTVLGPAVMGILDPTATLPMGINLLRGRVILQPAEDNGTAGAAKSPMKVTLTVHGVAWQLELSDLTTKCGAEVILREPREFEENFGTEGWSGKLYVWSGTVKLTNADGMDHTITGPGSFVLAKDPTSLEPPTIATTDLPNWERRLSTLAQKNARAFSDEFKSDESSARDSLSNLIESRVYEQSRLAVSCLGLIGDYESLLEVLDRNPHYESRVAAINGLRSWINQAPENREKLKTAIEAKFYPQELETVYRLIWGYQEQDARNKQTSEQLVDWMEHPRPAVRELAWFYIKSLTNRKQEVFDAMGTPMHRNTAVQRIRKILERDGTLLPPAPAKSARLRHNSQSRPSA